MRLPGRPCLRCRTVQNLRRRRCHRRFCYIGPAPREAPGISREETRPSDVAQPKEKHDQALETDATSAVRRTAPSKSIDIFLHEIGVYARREHPLLQHWSNVNPLPA